MAVATNEPWGVMWRAARRASRFVAALAMLAGSLAVGALALLGVVMGPALLIRAFIWDGIHPHHIMAVACAAVLIAGAWAMSGDGSAR